MTDDHALERIIVVPVNGYVNRLQAWASAAIMGAELDVPVQVLWEPETVAAAPAEALFTAQRIKMSFVEPSDVTGLLGTPHQDQPRYLTIDRERRIVFLAGHDRGEQAFMEGLLTDMSDTSEPTTLVIVAGGVFSLPGTEFHAETRRQAFYRSIDWHPTITQRVAGLLEAQPPFIGLHVRGTDRSHQAPTARALRGAVSTLATKTALQSVFIAADTADARLDWVSRLATLGLSPWTSGNVTFDRGQAAAGVDAIVDWIILGHSRAVAYAAESSFGREAAVAAGDVANSMGLHASTVRQRVRATVAFGKAVVTLPERRLTSGRGAA